MDVVNRETIQLWLGSDPYYAGRVPYLSAAADIISRLPGDTALEIGPYRHPLVPGCDTMDMDRRLPGITYYHDAGVRPWPMNGKVYDLIVGLQVWEHLEGRQRDATREALSRTQYLLLSFPYRWRDSPGRSPGHADIDRDTIMVWTCGRDPIETLRVASDAPGIKGRVDRILYLFEGDAA